MVLYKVVQTLESVDEIQTFVQSIERHSALLSCGTVYCAV